MLTKLIRAMVRIITASVLLTEALTLAFAKAHRLPIPQGAFSMLLFAGSFAVFSIIFLNMERLPRAGFMRSLEENGFSDKTNELIKKWVKKCGKRGYHDTALLALSELCMSFEKYKEAFECLSRISCGKLDDRQKIVYYNSYLYGAVICGDKAAADAVYNRSKLLLLGVTDDRLSGVVKHTLGCYEYMCGRLASAEVFFNQSLETAAHGAGFDEDLICEDNFGLCACYLETDRLMQAKYAAEQAAYYAQGADSVIQRKLERTKRLVELAFRNTQNDDLNIEAEKGSA